MKKFKSILALTASVLALSAFAAPVSAFADGDIVNTNGSWNPNANMNLSLAGKTASYTVTIPATVTFADLAATPTANIEATNVYLTTNLTVKATSTNGYKLINDIDTSNANNIAYTATVGGATVNSETELLTVAAGTSTGSSTLNFAINSGQTINYAGDYKDTWTFTIAPATPE